MGTGHHRWFGEAPFRERWLVRRIGIGSYSRHRVINQWSRVAQDRQFEIWAPYLQGKAHSKAINNTAPAGIPPRFGDWSKYLLNTVMYWSIVISTFSGGQNNTLPWWLDTPALYHYNPSDNPWRYIITNGFAGELRFWTNSFAVISEWAVPTQAKTMKVAKVRSIHRIAVPLRPPPFPTLWESRTLANA